MALTARSINNAAEVDAERAFELIAELKDQQNMLRSGVELYSGTHPYWGMIQVIVPSAGDSIVLFSHAVPDSFKDYPVSSQEE